MKQRHVQTAGTTAAVVTAAIMIAEQVGGKAVRDALFLSRFPVTSLPVVIMATTILSVATALLMARSLTRFGPHRVIPIVFAASASMLMAIWGLGSISPRGQAVALFLHVSVIGMVQISGFWSLVNESYDSRTAKRRIGQIAAGGTLGGLVGGLLAERIGSGWGIGATLPMLAGLHVACAAVSLRLRPLGTGRQQSPASPDRQPAAEGAREGATRLGLRVLGQTPYLRSLATLVLLSTVAAAFVDYVFKMEAARTSSGAVLLRLFAGYYMAVGLVTFLVQIALGQRILERLGLTRTVAALPLGVAVGSLGALMAPGPVSAGVARGLEAILRNSLYRSGYEALFAPVPSREKRATKAIVDVGVERIGDAIAAAAIQLALLLSAVIMAPLLLGLALVCSMAGVAVTRRLREGYVAALERGLLIRARELNLEESADRRLVTQFTESLSPVAWAENSATIFLEPERDLSGAERPPSPSARPEETDLGVLLAESSLLEPAHRLQFRRILDLHSADLSRVRRAIQEGGPVDRMVAPHVIPLLAWEEVADVAGRALAAASDRIVGQLLDALLDPEEEFAIRRRIPRLLTEHLSPVAVEGLLQGLSDRRFEVRLRCGRALVRLQDGAGILALEADRVYLPVLREVAVDRTVWESQRLLDLTGEDEESGFVDQFLRDRVNRSLEHVFTMLSLVLPRRPLQVAFRGLHADDPALRGTALDYLESVLPVHVWAALWPLLEDRRPPGVSRRSRDEVLADLVRASESMAIDLRALQGPPETRSEIGGLHG